MLPMPAAHPVDQSKSETAIAIRASVARLSPISLRRLKENLFRLELSLVEDMITGGVDPMRCQAISHCARTIEVVEQLQGGLRARS